MTPEPDAAADETIDPTFRSGSLTAIGLLAGFSLSFLTRWSATPGDWSPSDLAAVIIIIIGIVAQILSLAGLLSVNSLLLRHYNRLMRLFIAGLALVVAGVVLAVFADILGLGVTVLRGS